MEVLTILPPFDRHRCIRLMASFQAWSRFRATVALGLLLFSIEPSAFAAIAPESRDFEYRVKSAYLYNFTRFVNWPKDVLANDEEPMVIGVLDLGDGAAPIVAETFAGKTSPDGRPLEVRVAREVDSALLDAQILFVTRSASTQLSTIRELIGTRPILLVGETEGFATSGGTINLQLVSTTVRCEINVKRAERAGLKLSGRLSSVARVVRDSAIN